LDAGSRWLLAFVVGPPIALGQFLFQGVELVLLGLQHPAKFVELFLETRICLSSRRFGFGGRGRSGRLPI
jgi:hypothetical protein